MDNNKQNIVGNVKVPVKPSKTVFDGRAVSFCEKCGTIVHLDDNGLLNLMAVVRTLQKENNVEVFDIKSFNIRSHYFSIEGCNVCEGAVKSSTLKMKNL